VKIRTLGLFASSALIASVHAYRTPAAGIRNGRRQLGGAYVVSIQVALFSLSSKPTLFSPLMLLQLLTPSNSISVPSLALMLSTFLHPPFLHLQLSPLNVLEDAYTDADLSDSWRRSDG
jgi:hypothetical protein